MNNVKKSIGWADYTVNPVRGKCPVGCSYCYAERMRQRFHRDAELTYHDEVFDQLPKKPSRIFVGSTIDLFHFQTINYLPRIMEHVTANPQHTFIFLTKCPQNLPHEWPANCWVGVSATDTGTFISATNNLILIDAKLKFLSFEPLLNRIQIPSHHLMLYAGIDWVIIGAQTPFSKKTAPKIEWVKEIVEAADKAGVPVFLKENLKPLFKIEKDDFEVPNWAGSGIYGSTMLRQEFPAL